MNIVFRPARQFLAVGAAILLLSGCASIPAPLVGDFAEFQPNQATDRSVGAQVRWGGTIVETQPSRDETCVEILARDLDRELRPIGGDNNFGRFLACRSGFQDPAIFTTGRDITVVGRVQGFVDGEIGDFVYRYPRLSAEVIYLWPERPDMVLVRGGGFYDPFWWDPWWPHRHPRSRISGSVIIIR
ncbi:MAG: Slp family lipoprotein [Wenzhouxiangella sp.]